jgi:hypothetical protein
MKFFRLDLLTLLISLFILNSCKNQDTVGLGLNSSGVPNGTLVDTSTIVTNTVAEDSVATSGLAKNPLAFFNDPVFGTTEANLATDLNLPSSGAFLLPSGQITIDSALLVLHFADGFYGDSLSSSYTINVFQLNEKFSKNITYYNTKNWGIYTNSPLLGTLTFASRTHTAFKIKTIVAGGPDTLVQALPQIRIPIDHNFIINNLFNASSTTLGSNTIFNNVIRGLYLTIDKTKSTGPGGIFMISAADSLAVYYRTVNGAAIDTDVFYLPISNLAAQIKHTYSMTIQAELSNTTTSSGTIYLQGLAGLKAKISFPSLLLNLRKSLLSQGSDLVINRAEIVVTPSPGTDKPYAPLPKLTMYRLDIAHQPVLVEDASAADPRAQGVSVFGGFYNTTNKQYHFIVTAYMQDLLLNKTIDYGTFIAPIDTTNTTSVDIAPTPQVAARTIAGGGANKSSGYSIKLNIIYTKIAK